MFTNYGIVLCLGFILTFGIVAVATELPCTLGIQDDITKSAVIIEDMALQEADLKQLYVVQSQTPQNSGKNERPSLWQYVKAIRALEHDIKRTRKPFCKNKGECKSKRRALKEKLRHFRHAKLKFETARSEAGAARGQTAHDGGLHSRIKRGATSDRNRLWTNGIIPYEFKLDDYNSNSLSSITSAMHVWEEATCLVFKEREPEDVNYLVIKRTDCGCCAAVGMQGTGPQVLSLGKGCLKKDIAMHEMGHSIGFYHEHNRPDRDKYVKIIKANMKDGMYYAFTKKGKSDVDSLGEPYDYQSIMHYSSNKFAKVNVLDTIQAILQPGQTEVTRIKPRFKLSEGDIRQTNKLYRCASCGKTLYDYKGFGNFNHSGTRGKPETCQWRIKVTPGSIVELNIISLQVPGDCKNSYLEVRDGFHKKHPLIGRYCGRNVPGVLRSTTERMWVEFKTTSNRQSFTAKYKETCSGDYISKKQGALASPGFPLRYPPNVNCTWVLRSQNKDAIFHVTFGEFFIEYNERKCRDYIEVRDGPTKESDLIGQYCALRPKPIQSTGPEMLIQFYSNRRIQKSGVNLNYIEEVDECMQHPSPCAHVCENTVGSFTCSCNLGFELHSDGSRCIPKCGGVFKSGTGSIISPSFPDLYAADKSCEWLFQAPRHYRIFIDFTHFDLEGDIFDDCDKDYLKITEGTDEDSVGKFCGFLPPPSIVSKTNTLKLEFVSDSTVQRSGFNITYHIDKDECLLNNGGCDHGCENIIDGFRCTCLAGYSLQSDMKTCKQADQCSSEINQPRGTFFSVDFPLDYPARQDCTWSLTTLVGHRVRIRFKSFSVEYHRMCRYDHLAIYDGKDDKAPKLATYCGYKPPEPVISSSNQMFLYFFSDASRQYLGFFIEHDSLCSGSISASTRSQTLVSHGNFGHDNYDNREDCHWNLQADEGYVIEIIFDDFDVEFEETCSYDSVRVYDGDSDSDPVLGNLCGNQTPTSRVTSGDSMYIRFTSDDTLNDRGFKLIFHQLLPSDVRK